MLRITPKIAFKRPVEVSISPEKIEKKAYYGRKRFSIDELFSIEECKGSYDIFFDGDFSMVRNLGRRMKSGRIYVKGDAGDYLGAYMKGGEIYVSGKVKNWAGACMRGGKIFINEDAGSWLGAACWGEQYGMRGGKIIVKGSSLAYTGFKMRGGLIYVKKVKKMCGALMRGGTIICSDAGYMCGALMRGGTIICKKCYLPPSFSKCSTYFPCLLYTSPSPRELSTSRMPSSA